MLRKLCRGAQLDIKRNRFLEVHWFITLAEEKSNSQLCLLVGAHLKENIKTLFL